MTAATTTTTTDANRTVRVFISSTFLDMHAERDVLVTTVFPELRERLDWLGLELYDVDLRWGIPTEDIDGEPSNAWAYCKQWIGRVEPFFICMIGQRYGKPPVAGDLADLADFQNASITEMEIRHALSGRGGRKRTYFYTRATLVPHDAPAVARKIFVDPDEAGRLEHLKTFIKDSRRPLQTYPAEWTGTEFAGLDRFSEMVLEDLWSGVLRDPRYVSPQIWQDVLGRDPTADRRYVDESEPIPRDVWEKIVRRATPDSDDPLFAERKAMAAFARARTRWFTGRTHDLGTLRSFITESQPPEESNIYLVAAARGEGKSALLARLSQEFADTSLVVISHFVGATDRSADVRSLLIRLTRELDAHRLATSQRDEAEQDVDTLATRLAAHLEGYAGDRRVVLIIDGLDQLSTRHDMSWLPKRVGPNVRLILSCISEQPSGDGSLDSVRRAIEVRSRPRIKTIETLADSDVLAIINDYLVEYCKELDPPHRTFLAGLKQTKTPLYLLVLLHELRSLGGDGIYLAIGAVIADVPRRYPDVTSLFDWVLERSEFFRLPAVAYWWSYLAVSRRGMSSRELTDLLRLKLGADGAKAALRVERLARKYLQRRGTQMDFYHEELRQAALRRYAETCASAHIDVAQYFRTRSIESDPHALSELPHHQTIGRMWKPLRETLGSVAFVGEKCRHGMSFDVVADFDAAQAALSQASELLENDDAIPLLARFVARFAQRLSRHPDAFMALLHHEAEPPLRALCNNTVRTGLWLHRWIRTTPVALPASEHGVERAVLTLQSQFRFEGRRSATLSDDGRHAFYLRTLGEIAVVDVAAGADIRSDLNIDARPVLALAATDGRIAIAYDNGTLHVIRFDIATRQQQLESAQTCVVPDIDAPILRWLGGALWFQRDDQSIVSLREGETQVFTLPPDCTGELSALAPGDSGCLASIHGTEGSTLIRIAHGDASAHLRLTAQVACMAECDSRHVVCATFDFVVRVFETDRFTEVARIDVSSVPLSIQASGFDITWANTAGAYFRWDAQSSKPAEAVDATAFSRYAERTIAIVHNGGVFSAVTESGVARFTLGGSTTADERSIVRAIPLSRGGALLLRQLKDECWLLNTRLQREVRLQTHIVPGLLGIDDRDHVLAVSTAGRCSWFETTALSDTPRTVTCIPMSCLTPAANGFWLADHRGGLHHLSGDLSLRAVGRIGPGKATIAGLYASAKWLLVHAVGRDEQMPGEAEEDTNDLIIIFEIESGTPPRVRRRGARTLLRNDGFVQGIEFDGAGEVVHLFTRRDDDRVVRLRSARPDGLLARSETVRDIACTDRVACIARTTLEERTAWYLLHNGIVSLVDGDLAVSATLALAHTVRSIASSPDGGAVLVDDNSHGFALEVVDPTSP